MTIDEPKISNRMDGCDVDADPGARDAGNRYTGDKEWQMTYTQQGERVTLEMTRADYDTLMLALGLATGAAAKISQRRMWRWLAFVNDLNRTNPDFKPYKIPEEYPAERIAVPRASC